MFIELIKLQSQIITLQLTYLKKFKIKEKLIAKIA